jgi:LysR family glycine cleavage system transcriptional activator
MTINRKLLPGIEKLQAFECAARHASFTRAAEELNLTQSAVSRQIKELELQLGVKLFERVRQRVLLSSVGQKYLPDVRALLVQAEEAALRVISAPNVTLLNLAILPSFGTLWLVPRLPDFLKRNPEVAFYFASSSKYFDFNEHSFDAAIHFGQPIWAGGTCRFICNAELVPVASPRLIMERGTKLPDQMAVAPLLHLTARPTAWSAWLDLNGLDNVPMYASHRFDHFGMVIQAAIIGLGFGLVPRCLVETDLREGRLKVVPAKLLPTENSYYFVVPDHQRENPFINDLYDWIVEHVNGDRPTSIA